MLVSLLASETATHLKLSSFFTRLKFAPLSCSTPPSRCSHTATRSFSKTFLTAALPMTSTSHDDMIPSTPISVDLHAYIDAIEQMIQNGKPTFRARLRYQNQKPIIRTLLNVQSKDEFDKSLRTQQKKAEYEKMKEFCLNLLQPRIHSLPDEDRIKAPQFDEGLELALGSSLLKTKGAQAFHRIASGRVYKGKLIDLVMELVPELEQQCRYAMMPLTEEEVLMHLIRNVADQKEFECKDNRINAAFKCVGIFQSNGSDGSDAAFTNNIISKANGLECEQICVDWLTNQQTNQSVSDSKRIVLSNVMINNNTTKSRQKYLNTNKIWNNGSNTRSIMWTSSQRDRVCSEFDAVVLHDSEQPSITEIWEAKYSMSPSSIHDALTKKVPAIKTLLQDPELSVSFDGCQQMLGKQSNCIVLGLFGMELLPPENALGQLRSTAISHALTSDLDVTLKAIDNGFVELGTDTILDYMKKLRQKYVESCRDFDIVVKVASTP